MDVIGHKAIREDRQAFATAVFIQEVEICFGVTGFEKHPFAVVPTLCDVVRDTGENDSMASRHPSEGIGFAMKLGAC
jgi:hypothetical protein